MNLIDPEETRLNTNRHSDSERIYVPIVGGHAYYGMIFLRSKDLTIHKIKTGNLEEFEGYGFD
jgi:hypothetical protein